MRPSREPKEQQFASGHKYSQKKEQENQEEGEKLVKLQYLRKANAEDNIV